MEILASQSFHSLTVMFPIYKCPKNSTLEPEIDTNYLLEPKTPSELIQKQLQLFSDQNILNALKESSI